MYGGLRTKEITIYSLKTRDQGLNKLSQQDYLPIMVESFLIDRKSQGLSPETIELYIQAYRRSFAVMRVFFKSSGRLLRTTWIEAFNTCSERIVLVIWRVRLDMALRLRGQSQVNQVQAFSETGALAEIVRLQQKEYNVR
jgi:hypothetical protein